jgi:hypothetical protein
MVVSEPDLVGARETSAEPPVDHIVLAPESSPEAGRRQSVRVSRSPALAVRAAPSAVRRVLLVAILGAVCLLDGVAPQAYRAREAAAPFAFNLLGWEIRQVGSRLGGLALALRGGVRPADDADAATLRAYFQASAGVRAGLRDEAEAAIERLVTDGWRSEELAAPSPPAGGEQTIFPPVTFTFTAPPQVLIISPRDRIEVQRYVLLRPSLSPQDVGGIEDGAVAPNTSTLVAPVGGLATYPAMVPDTGSAEASLAAVAHEWVHAYFFFHPLGRAYWADQAMRTINETAAELAGNELGARLARQLGFPTDPSRLSPGSPAALSPRQIEFNTLMRQTRLEVDRLLALGRVTEAEQYMEQRRVELNARGFGIRRLNQAYFAFYGSYAESPAGSSPLAPEVRSLRNRSATLGDFLRAIAQVDHPGDLVALVGQASG